MPTIHVCKAAETLQEFYREAFPADFSSVVELIEEHSGRLLKAHHAGDSICAYQISNWHPDLICKSPSEILAAEFNLGDARLTIMRELGYSGEPSGLMPELVSMMRFDSAFDQQFEQAVDLALAGHTNELGALLERRPELATQRSAFSHRATLLIYLAANGVEMWRQVVPSNVAEVAELLIAHGSDRRATMRVYGGDFDAFALAETSAHPKKAGVLEELLDVLR